MVPVLTSLQRTTLTTLVSRFRLQASCRSSMPRLLPQVPFFATAFLVPLHFTLSATLKSQSFPCCPLWVTALAPSKSRSSTIVTAGSLSAGCLSSSLYLFLCLFVCLSVCLSPFCSVFLKASLLLGH